MAADTTFTHGAVFEHERSALRGVTLQTCVVGAQQRESAAFDLLGKTGATAFDGAALVRIVAIRAAHLSFEHWVTMRQHEFRAHFQVTLEARIRRLPRVHDCSGAAARFNVFAARTVTAFAAHLLGVIAFCC